MIIKKEKINQIFDDNISFFDIETSGFSPKNSIVTTISYSLNELDGFFIKQIMIEDELEEILLLSNFFKDMKKIDLLISFNGQRFDIPFIVKRAEVLSLKENITSKKSLDLYKYLKKNSAYIGLKPCGQKELEKIINFQRPFEMNGKKAVEDFYQFLKTKDMAIADRLMDYNKLDVLGLIEIYELYLKIEDIIGIDLALEEQIYKLKTCDITRKNDLMHISFDCQPNLSFDLDYKKNNFHIVSKDDGILLKLELKKGLLNEKCVGYCFDCIDLNIEKLKKYSPYNLKDKFLALEADKEKNKQLILELAKVIIKNVFN